MMPQTTSKSKSPAYKPHIRKESANTYTCQSESYGGYILYTLTVRHNGHITCDCTAGSFGRSCKHAKAVAALVAYNARPMHLGRTLTLDEVRGLGVELFA